MCRETEMRKAHETYLTQVERDARKREADRKAEDERLRRNEVQALNMCMLLLQAWQRRCITDHTRKTFSCTSKSCCCQTCVLHARCCGELDRQHASSRLSS